MGSCLAGTPPPRSPFHALRRVPLSFPGTRAYDSNATARAYQPPTMHEGGGGGGRSPQTDQTECLGNLIVVLKPFKNNADRGILRMWSLPKAEGTPPPGRKGSSPAAGWEPASGIFPNHRTPPPTPHRCPLDGGFFKAERFAFSPASRPFRRRPTLTVKGRWDTDADQSVKN